MAYRENKVAGQATRLAGQILKMKQGKKFATHSLGVMLSSYLENQAQSIQLNKLDDGFKWFEYRNDGCHCVLGYVV